MKEVAEHAGVALSSVSRVLNDHPDVSAGMRSRVLDSIAALGYEPNLLASSLRRGATNTIGFIVMDIGNPLFAEIVRGAERVLDDAGYAMFLTNSEGSAAREEEMARRLRWRQVDGLIISLADETHPGTLAELRSFEPPLVLVDRQVTSLPSASTVVADHAGGMAQATEHLLELGHRRIALITGSRKLRPARERLKAFTDAHTRWGFTSSEGMTRIGDFTPSFGEESAAELMDQADPPTAIIAGGNLLLSGVLRSLRSRGIRVGEEVALISCDDVPLSELYSPPITVIDRDNIHMGETAAELLLERLESETVEPRQIVLPTRLVLRESTFPI